MPTDTTIETTPVGQHARGLPESSHIDARSLGWLAVGTLLFLAVTVAVLHITYSYEVPIKTVPAPRNFPQPRVRTDETAELKQLLAKQHRALTGYHWANSAHTLVQLPIERAMDLIAQKGAQAYDPVAAITGALAAPDAGAERTITPAAGGTTEKPP